MAKRTKSIVTPADEGMRAGRRETGISDDENPEFIFATTHTTLLCRAVKGEIDLLALAKKQLRNRGFNEDGAWVGFNKG